MVVGGGEDDDDLLASISLQVLWLWWWLSEKELMTVGLCGNSNLMGSESKESPLDRKSVV